jgi:hypothetical protein
MILFWTQNDKNTHMTKRERERERERERKTKTKTKQKRQKKIIKKKGEKF